ncbi:hypothetical protein BDK51DRAFT_41233 [Blyttiomyces helicus]|uniref:MYND-type domain-containing protein n=1 Tax=Blyttiomyces helicus TaxID=388810 RepID=A0A4P9WMQ0_9FUNG|nr:hypothetical protein BDK51DRAFT_41233 [Blyttiomyces helicus]|eukprot:RKO93303.1 hypothetical protein BDK51DRAFT_41233 [Blyttiomyces helicus]
MHLDGTLDDLSVKAAVVESLVSMEVACEKASRGEWRSSADSFRSAYEGKQLTSPHRYLCLHLYTKILHDNHILYQRADDAAFLRGLLNDKAQPLLHRVTCGFTIGFINCAEGKYDVAGRVLREDELAHSASAAYRSTFEYIELVRQNCGELLDKLVDEMRTILDTGEDLRDIFAEYGVSGQEDGERPDGDPTSPDHIAVPLGPQAPGSRAQQGRLKDAIIERVHRARSGLAGGACGGSTRLKKCAGCKRAAYCSPTCQQADWKRHRPSCRAPNVFVAADLVRIACLTSAARRDLNGSVVEVRGQVPARVDHWRLGAIGDPKDVRIHVEKLALIVPTGERCQMLQRNASELILLAHRSRNDPFKTSATGFAAETGPTTPTNFLELHFLGWLRRFRASRLLRRNDQAGPRTDIRRKGDEESGEALLAAISNLEPTSAIHGGTLLKAIRTTYNILILSKFANIQIVAETALPQMVYTVFDRAETENEPVAESERPSIVRSHRDHAGTPNADVSRKDSFADPAAVGPDVTAIKNQYMTDSYLDFRALCKLRIEPIDGRCVDRVYRALNILVLR